MGVECCARHDQRQSGSVGSGYTMSVKYGTAEATPRYYLLTSGDRKILFGYDAENHQPSPVFKAEIN